MKKNLEERFLGWCVTKASDEGFKKLASLVRQNSFYEADETLGLVLLYAFTLKEGKVKDLRINKLVENINSLESTSEKDPTCPESESD